LIIVPALNEEGAIGAVVRDARALLQCDVVVIDDGSTDRTAAIAHDSGAIVLSLPFNLGVGGAIRTALHYAEREGYERVAQIDGDGQHDPLEVKRLLAELDKGFNVVVGSRFSAGYELSGSRRFAMRRLSSVVSRRLGVPVTDTTSGFRAMDRRAIEFFARQYPVDYLSDTVEALLLAADAGLRVSEVGVRMHQRTHGTPSSGRAKSLYHLGRLSLVIALHHLRGRSRNLGDTE